MEIEARVGSADIDDGQVTRLRASRTTALVVTQGHGALAEAAVRGALFIASTAVGGVAPGTALSTTPPMAIWNPPNSGKNVVVMKSALGLVSGTLGGGSLVYASLSTQITAPTTGTELTPACTKIGYPRGVARAFQGSTLIGTPALIKPAFTLGALVGTTAVPPANAVDDVDGEIVIPPGCILALQGVAAAGTTPLVMIAVTYEEVPE